MAAIFAGAGIGEQVGSQIAEADRQAPRAAA
jgi:hypothetical protein